MDPAVIVIVRVHRLVQSADCELVGVENAAASPAGGEAVNTGVSVVHSQMVELEDPPTRTSLAVNAAAGVASTATTPSVAITTLALRSAFTSPS